jgi:RimJ/RimL family protein N-acetyltransferase
VPLAIEPVTLKSADLVLRPLRSDDEADIASAMTDPDLLNWAAGLAVADSAPADRAGRWLAPRMTSWSAGTAAFAVVDAATQRFLGNATARDVDRVPGQAVMSYWVTPAARGRGVAARALDVVSRWALKPATEGGLGLYRLQLDHALANAGSCRVAEKAGYRYEGTMRGSFVDPHRQRHDSHLHARLVTD